MLRNLNRSSAGQRICGTPHVGIRGALIPSTGTSGPPPLFNDLSLPADADKEYRFRITRWPSFGSLFMDENSAFVYAPSQDGADSFDGELWENDVVIGTETVSLTSGAGQLTVNATVGNASAAGFTASVYQGRTIAAQVGNAVAAGLVATVSNASSAPGGVVDASAISVSRTVNFGGGTNRVDFDGGTNRVNF